LNENLLRTFSFIFCQNPLSVFEIRAFIQSIRSAGEQLKQNANSRFVLEVLMLDIPEVSKHAQVKSAV